MGACYSVNLDITLKDETAAIKAMQEYIKKEQFHINFGLEDNRKRGIGIGTFADLLQIFFSSCNGPVYDVLREDDHIVYDSDFDASYSWESVMTEIFDCIAPFLEDESSLGIYPDNENTGIAVTKIHCYICAFLNTFAPIQKAHLYLCIYVHKSFT